jgi:hypothetical protein
VKVDAVRSWNRWSDRSLTSDSFGILCCSVYVMLLNIGVQLVASPAPTAVLVSAMGEDPMAYMSKRRLLEELEQQAAAALITISMQRQRAQDEAMVAAVADKIKRATKIVDLGVAAVAATNAKVVEANEPVSGSPRFAAVAAADEPESGSPRLRRPVAKVYGEGPIETGPPACGATARWPVPKGASKWHKLWLRR